MIEHLVIDKVASYDGPTQFLQGFSKFNYFYGANGAGKTTISKIINAPDEYATCHIKWKDNNKLISYVYNKDFVEKNFNQDEIKGVFTLGDDAKKCEEELLELNNEKKKAIDALIGKRKLIDGDGEDIGVVKNLEILEKEFKDNCWKQKVKHDRVFSKSFEGLRNSTEKFKLRVLSEHGSNTSDLRPLEELVDKAGKVFSDLLSLQPKIAVPNFEAFFNILNDAVWNERIVGKEDVSVAELIALLNNSDWVKKGLDYYDKSAPQCPLCQQSVDNDIFESLRLYFDDTYELKKNHVSNLLSQYESEVMNLRGLINNIKLNKSNLINYDVFEDKANVVLSAILANFEMAKNKRELLSESVKFKYMSDVLDDFNSFLGDVNNVIQENNEIYENRKTESDSLSKKFWAYLVKIELKDVIDEYISSNLKLEKKLKGLRIGIEKDSEKIAGYSSKIELIESNQTSIIPTIHQINAILNCYGFKNFHLKPSEDKSHYVIVRDTGDNARTTLSEGEKTFITFLYYYSLVRGSDSAIGVSDDRIVVFDDPISSLDSDILFIVSSLIKDLMDDVRESKGCIKQVIFLTHNIYFHKKLTFNPSRSGGQAMNEETFWMVRKKNKSSYLEKCEFNPIKTSYDLLWSELRRNDINNNTIQNTMRRILENYFKILGGMDVRKLECHFVGSEKVIFRSLVSWINDGSHFSGDDLYMNLDDASVEKNMTVFQKIFEKSEHTAHYKMMMGDFYKTLENNITHQGEVEVEDSANDAYVHSPNVAGEELQPLPPQAEVPF